MSRSGNACRREVDQNHSVFSDLLLSGELHSIHS